MDNIDSLLNSYGIPYSEINKMSDNYKKELLEKKESILWQAFADDAEIINQISYKDE